MTCEHGHAKRGAWTSTYKSWRYMRDRVARDPDYAHVGICQRWNKFSNFLADMGEKPEDKTLDRIDNYKPYGPDNCRWASSLEQHNNKTVNTNITWRGLTKTLSDWARELSINYKTLHNRLEACGWSVDRAFTTPHRGWSKYMKKGLQK